eukprot:Em0020g259a
MQRLLAWPLEDFDKTDEIVTQLYLIIDEVEVLIPILRDERSPDLNTLIELHAALFQLLALTWSGPGRRPQQKIRTRSMHDRFVKFTSYYNQITMVAKKQHGAPSK